MKLIKELLFILTFTTGLVGRSEQSTPHHQQLKISAFSPKNTEELALKMENLRAEMAPFLQSLPTKLDVREITILSGNDWVKRFEVAPNTTTGVPQPAWEKIGLDLSKWNKTEVPEWNYTKQAVKNPASCILWYRKDFKATQPAKGKRTFLVFKAVDWRAEVWLNGQKLGGHSVYFEPFKFDVTNTLSKSGHNTLAVRILDGPLYGEPQAFWGPFPIVQAKEQRYVRDRSKSLIEFKPGDSHIGGGYGIFGDVLLETTGSSAINEIKVRGYTANDEAVVQVFSDVKGAAPTSVNIELLPENFKGKIYSKTVPFQSNNQIAQQILTVKIPDARRWSPDAPWLYRCRVSLLNTAGAIIDSHDALFGHRTIEMVSPSNPKEGMQEGMLLLDGNPLYLRGSSTQGLNALSFWNEDETLHNILLLLKVGNFNAIRSCQHVQPPRVRELLDRYGIMSQQDVGSRYPTRRQSPKILPELLKASKAIARVCYNNPGVVFISFANETEFNPKAMIKVALQEDPERLMIPISGHLSRIRPDQYPKWVSKKYYSWHHTYIINKNAWKGKLPESMRNQILDSIHPYWGWYPEKGRLDNWCRPQKPGRMVQVGEYGSEALDGYETMKDYPASFGRTPSKSADVLWGHQQVVKNDIRQVVGFRGTHPSNLGEYIQASQTYQADQLSQMTKAWRLSPNRVAAYFQFHFIDVLAANWPKSIVSHDLTPKKAYFALAQINQALVPLPRVLAGGNEMELWVSNHKKENLKNCQIDWTATSKGEILTKGSQKVDVQKFDTVLAGIADLSGISKSVKVMNIHLVLKDSNGKQLSNYVQEIYIHAWRTAGGLQFPIRKETTAWMEAEAASNITTNPALSIDQGKLSATSRGKSLAIQPAYHPGKLCSPEWNCHFSTKIKEQQLLIRHAGDKPVKIRLQIDGKPLGTFVLAPSKGWGYKKEEWAWTAISLPKNLIQVETTKGMDVLESGRKEVKVCFNILSAVNFNIDCIALAPAKIKQPVGTRKVKLSKAIKQTGPYSIYSSFQEMYAATDSIHPPLKTLTKGPKFHWFGYYLHYQTDPSGRYLLVAQVDFQHRLQKPTDAIKVGMIDLQNNNKWIELGESRAWSWQQDCFLQWRPGSDTEVVWNDREGNRAVTRIIDIKTRKIRTLPRAIDEVISSDGKWALCTDFSRLWKLQPGYGYPGIENPSTKTPAPKDAGVWKMDMETGACKLIVSLHDLLKLPSNTKLNKKAYRYISHLDLSPDGKRFSAFYRGSWREPTHVYTMNTDGSDIRLMNDIGASHWAWRDNEHMVFWMHDHGKDVGYQIFKDDNSGKVKSTVWRAPNGHQTYIPGTNNTWMVTDTYPLGAKREQILYLAHIPTQRFIPLARLNSPKAYRSHWRCDLHPRLSRDGKTVFFESPHSGGRQIYMVNIGEVIAKATLTADQK